MSESKEKTLTKVEPELRPSARLLLVAEAPGEQEEIARRPLVGPTGQMVNEYLNHIKLPRNMWDITNVVQYRPPRNLLHPFMQTHPELIEEGKRDLQQLLKAKKYDAVLALGWFALKALTGKDGIHEYRGSVYRLENDTPIMATFHPAVLFHEPKLANIIFRDLYRFVEVVHGKFAGPPKRNLRLFPDKKTADAFAALPRTYLAVDIEADPRTKVLTRVGFAISATEGLTIEMGPEWTWTFVSDMLQWTGPKVFHNAAFDVPFLKYNCNLVVNGQINDTMIAHHTLYPEFPQGLDFCASLYTNEPYWKDLGRHQDEREQARYNGLDVTVTAEIWEAVMPKLKSLGLLPTYERDINVLPIAIKMSLRGIKYDKTAAKVLGERVDTWVRRWQAILDKEAGWHVNVYSHPQVCKLLYEQLNLPIQYERDKKTGEQKVTTGQKKLLMLYPEIWEKRTKRIMRALLNVRRYRKIKTTYLWNNKTNRDRSGPDGRMRTTFSPAHAETGRWSASTFLIDQEGVNMQTVQPEWQSCFEADEGKLLWQADYKQIEAMLVAYDAEDLKQIEVFENPERDIHRENAARLLKKPVPQVSKMERQYIGKTVHAMNYLVGAKTMAEGINKRGLETGMFVTTEFTNRCLQMYMSTYKEVQRWQKRIWEEGKETRVLTTYMGRRRIFTGPTKDKFARVTMGEMIAFKPQGTVPDMLNEAMIRIDRSRELIELGNELLLQIHDALMGQFNEDAVETAVPIIRSLMSIPLTIRGRQCIVPVDIKVGKHWNTMEVV